MMMNESKILRVKKSMLGTVLILALASTTLSGCGKKESVLDSQKYISENGDATPVTYDESSKIDIPNIGAYSGNSIVEALEQSGYDSSLEYRKTLAEFYGISNYEGTEGQNLALLNFLKEYASEYGTVYTVSDYTEEDWNVFSRTQEYRIDKNGDYVFRDHSYGESVVTDEQRNGFVIETTTRTCSTCGYKDVQTCDIMDKKTSSNTSTTTTNTSTVVTQPTNDWYVYSVDQERRLSSDGKTYEYRNHNYGPETVTQEQKNGYILETRTKKCSTCGYERVEEKQIFNKVSLNNTYKVIGSRNLTENTRKLS